MLKIKKIFGLFIVWFIAVGLSSIPLNADEVRDKKYKLSICAIFKNEASCLKEWIEFHRLIGVDHFYLYNNGSRDGYNEILRPYIKEGLVTLVHWPDFVPNVEGADVCHWVLTTQVPAYEHAAKYRALNETEWLVFVDVDEYLVPIHGNTIVDILNKYDEYPGLELTCDYFDASSLDVHPRRDLLIQTVTLIGAPVQNIQKSVEKTIFKPEYHTSFTWPPYKCVFKDNKTCAKLGKNVVRINKYMHRFKGLLNFKKVREKVHVDSRSLTENETRELLEIGFEIEDKERAIHRFEFELRKRMGLETGSIGF